MCVGRGRRSSAWSLLWFAASMSRPLIRARQWQPRVLQCGVGAASALFLGLLAVLTGRALGMGAVTSFVGAGAAFFVFASGAAWGLDLLLSGLRPGRARWSMRLGDHLDRASSGRDWSDRFSLRCGAIGDVPIRLHATLPLGMALVGGGGFLPGRWAGLVLLVLFHELGHAALMRLYAVRVTGILLHGAGGECSGRGAPTPLQRAQIAWGGVLAQCLVWAIVALTAGKPRDPFIAEVIWVFTVANPALIVLNLLPVPPLDGALAWRLPILLSRRGRPPAPRSSVGPLAGGTVIKLADRPPRARRGPDYLN